MKIIREIQPAAELSEQGDTDTKLSPSIVRLGNISELVEGASGYNSDGSVGNFRR